MLILNQLSGFGASSGRGPAQTAWSATLDTNDSGSANYCIRTKAGLLLFGGNQVRVRFVAPTSGSNFTVDNASIGVMGGATAPDCTTDPPVELKFSGSSGFNLTAGNTITSDWTDLVTTTSDYVIVNIDHASTGGGARYTSSGYQGDWLQASYNGYNLADVTMGLFAAAGAYGIDLIEVRT